MAGRLNGKVAVVTGGTYGIGYSIAEVFLEEGAKVIITGQNAEKGDAAAKELGAVYVQQDVAKPDSWKQVSDVVERRFGRLDAMVNNAGISINGSIEDMPLEIWQRTLDVNVTGVMLGCRMAIPLMKKNPGGPSGSIINMSSILGIVGISWSMAYNTSKGAVRLLTKSVAMHCAQQGYRIRCNSIHPGTVDTPMLSNFIAQQPDAVERRKFFEAMQPIGFLGNGRDVGKLALYLASDDSRYMTGSELVIDGGVIADGPYPAPSPAV